MAHPTPPQVQSNLDQFRQALHAVEGLQVDPLTAPWTEIERSVIKLLGGAFQPQNQNHTGVAVMVAAALAGRLSRDLGAFWFPHRATLEGAALGFPEAMMVVSPLEVTLQALSRARLALLDDVARDLKNAIAEARGRGGVSSGEGALGPDDYRRLLDPALAQFVCLDPAKAREARETTPTAETRELERAFGKLPKEMPKEMKQSMRQQILGALGQLDAGKPLQEQAEAAPQLLELLALVHGVVEETGFAPAEFWQGVLLPLLHIGAADAFPPLDDDELQAVRQGADPLLLYVESVPFKVPTEDEDGLLGVFPPEEVSLIDECFEGISAPRLLRLPLAPLEKARAGFDPPKVRAAVEKFTAYALEQAGTPAPPGPAAGGPPALLDVGLRLLADLELVIQKAASGGGDLCLRQATEAEAASHPAVRETRKALQAPRIILAG